MIYNYNYLSHHGILGQKWGVRRFQNPDGTLTAAGKRRYQAESIGEISSAKGIQRRLNDVDTATAKNRRRNYEAQKAVTRDILKYDKYKKSGDDKGRIKYEKKTTKNLNNLIDTASRVQKGREETARLINKATERGYTINTRMVYRNVETGKDRVNRYLLILASGPIIGNTARFSKTYEEGTKYRVHKNK